MRTKEEINEYLKGLKSDEKYLVDLYNAANGYLRFIAFRYLVDKSFVDDVVSCAFYKIFSNIKTFDETQNGMSWIYKITKNEAYGINNRERKHAHESLDAIRDTVACTLNDDEQLRFIASLDRALNKLPEMDREIVEMRVFQGLTYQEIADTFGMYVGTLYKRYKTDIKIIWKDIYKSKEK